MTNLKTGCCLEENPGRRARGYVSYEKARHF